LGTAVSDSGVIKQMNRSGSSPQIGSVTSCTMPSTLSPPRNVVTLGGGLEALGDALGLDGLAGLTIREGTLKIEGNSYTMNRLKDIRDWGVLCSVGGDVVSMDRQLLEEYWLNIVRCVRRGGSRKLCVLSGKTAEVVMQGLNRLTLGNPSNVQHVDRSSPEFVSEGCCCGGESCRTFKTKDTGEEVHPRCLYVSSQMGLVNMDLLAYLRPYAMFQKRTANLVGVLKGRAMLWRRRQCVSEHCFAHFLPGTIVEAMKMSDEEVYAIRELGELPSACTSVYSNGINPARLTGWWRRGGTESFVSPWRWLCGTFKVGA